ncbi:branched-chain amino acid transaminase [Facilibium subflavum]|uniref:branched-chain amino acid transaminase n=1 Tax=Facilibium subflavum TaxID=2219058 RepID=UPI000E649B53|nr:branched-chain amino acid transaminase [Facilibium subflavum]
MSGEQQYIWQNGALKPRDQAVTHVMSHGLHYGTGVFEGIRAYKTKKGTAILQLKAHMDRFLYSMNAIGMQSPYSVDELCQAVIETIQKNQHQSCYIRPLAYYGDAGSVRVLPQDNHPIDIIIACLPMGRYLDADSVDVMTSQYIRIHPKSTICDAKISGHYINSMLATMACQGTHYHEALLLDADGFVAEGAAQNIFIVKDGKLITTPLGTILDGITRRLVIDIAQKLDIPVVEQYFTPDEVIKADEAFFSGTAAEITPIKSLDDQQINQHGKVGAITKDIMQYFNKITNGDIDHGFMTYISQEVIAS